MIPGIIAVVICVLILIGIKIYAKISAKEAKALQERRQQKINALPSKVRETQNNIDYALKYKGYLTQAEMDQYGVNLALFDKADGKEGMYFFMVDNNIYSYKASTLRFGTPLFGVEDLETRTDIYHPSDIRFVAVTVGGVTTGGFEEYGNYYTTHFSSTGKGLLYCVVEGFKMAVLKFKVNSNLEKELNKNGFLSGIKKDKHGNRMLMHELSYFTKQKLDMAACSRNYDMYQNANNEAMKEAAFTKDESQYVGDWIINVAFTRAAFKDHATNN